MLGERHTRHADRAYVGSFSERKGMEKDKSEERDRPLGIGAVEKEGERERRRYKERKKTGK